MALISLLVAKAHLRITTPNTSPLSTEDADISLKLAAAEAIILDYLKRRTVVIESISVANPTVITTSVPHSLVTGVTYPILGTTTTPTVIGSHAVTVTSPTTVTIAVNVTEGQDAAAGTIGAAAWTDVTVPGPVQSAILLFLTHLYEHRGDDMERMDEPLWLAVERLLMRQRDPALA